MSESVNATFSSSPTSEAPETLAGVIWRRIRYCVAIILSGIILYYIASWVVLPLSNLAAPSLLLWTNGGGTGGGLGEIMGHVTLVLLGLLAAVFVATFLTHPDAPHTPMFCAFLGLAYLATLGDDGGRIQLVLASFQEHNQVRTLYGKLAQEAAWWGLLVLLTERFTVWLHHFKFTNIRWLTRYGVSWEQVQQTPLLSVYLSDAPKSNASRAITLLKNLGALLLATVIIMVVLAILLRSQEKGQTLFAGIVAGFAGAMLAGWAIPQARIWPVCLAVPAAVAAGYLWINQHGMKEGLGTYPGYAAFPLGRALPIDLVSMGVAGAILGAHMMIFMRVHHVVEQAD